MQAGSADVINSLPQSNFVSSAGARSSDLTTKKAAGLEASEVTCATEEPAAVVEEPTVKRELTAKAALRASPTGEPQP